jgi:uncharacterized protein (DUF2141 family)
MFIRKLALLCLACLGSTATHGAELNITVRNVLPQQGELLVTLFDRAQGFPDQPSANQPSAKVKPDGETVHLTIPNLPAGRWAVMVLQDLNGNGRADVNLVGFPKEPYGASNNKLPKLSAPKFEDAAVLVGDQGAALTIDLRRP